MSTVALILRALQSALCCSRSQRVELAPKTPSALADQESSVVAVAARRLSNQATAAEKPLSANAAAGAFLVFADGSGLERSDNKPAIVQISAAASSVLHPKAFPEPGASHHLSTGGSAAAAASRNLMRERPLSSQPDLPKAPSIRAITNSEEVPPFAFEERRAAPSTSKRVLSVSFEKRRLGPADEICLPSDQTCVLPGPLYHLLEGEGCDETGIIARFSDRNTPPECLNNGYYEKLGARKKQEDPFIGTDPREAFEYLSSLIPKKEMITPEVYLKVAGLLEGGTVSYRTATKTSVYSVSLEHVPQEIGWSITRRTYVHTGYGSWGLEYGIGSCLFFNLTHTVEDLPAKFSACIGAFRQRLYSTTNRKELLLAIVLFYIECEQLQPVPNASRTNLAILNYHLAKYGFPCTLLKPSNSKEIYPGDPSLIMQALKEKEKVDVIKIGNFSDVAILHPDILQEQIKRGMQKWCEAAGIDFTSIKL